MEASYNNPKGPVHIVTGAGGAPAFDTFGAASDFTRKRLKDWSYGKVIVIMVPYLILGLSYKKTTVHLMQ